MLLRPGTNLATRSERAPYRGAAVLRIAESDSGPSGRGGITPILPPADPIKHCSPAAAIPEGTTVEMNPSLPDQNSCGQSIGKPVGPI
jgi:hypothetical protein